MQNILNQSNILNPELSREEIIKLCAELIHQPAQILSAKIIPPGAETKGGIQRSVADARVSFLLRDTVARHFDGTRVISMATSPFPVLLDHVPAQIQSITASINLFHTQILPALICEFPFLQELLALTNSDFAQQEFSQRFDAIINNEGRAIIIDENTPDAGMSTIGPRGELLAHSLGLEHQVFDMNLMATALRAKFQQLEQATGITGFGPIVYLTAESPLSMNSTRRYELMRLSESTPIIHLSAHDIINSETTFLHGNELIINGVHSNRIVNLLSAGGILDESAKLIISKFQQVLSANPNLLILNRSEHGDRMLSARKTELGLLRLPVVQEFIHKNFPQFPVALLLASIAKRRLLFFSNRGKSIHLACLQDINSSGPIFDTLYAGNTGSLCNNPERLSLGDTFLKDPLGTATRGLLRLDTERQMKSGDMGVLIGFLKQHGLPTEHGKLFVLEDFIESQKFKSISPLQILRGDFSASSHTARVEIFHTMGRVIGLSATMGSDDVVHGGGGSFVQPILIKSFNHE